MAEALSMADIRAQQVLARDRVSFDYEKVFWRTLYGVGLFGIGAVTVKMGVWLGGLPSLDEIVSDFTGLDNKGMLNEDSFWRIYDDVEAGRSGGSVGYAGMVTYYVNAPDEWQALKDLYMPITDAGEQVPVKKPAVQVFVEGADKIINNYGPVVPMGIFMFGLVSEYSRTRSLKGALK